MFNTPDENRAEIDQLTAAETFIMGRNMFEGVPALKLEQVGSRAASSVTHVTYRVLS